MIETVRTRFAPSPTGYLHIGGARTALFNYLLAKRLGGKFLLRIEDTDQTRNIAGAEQKLLDDLRWLGLQWDEGPQVGGPAGPYCQSQRLERYAEHARRLLDEGRAYYAFETRAELDAMRQAAQQSGERGFRYPRPKSFPAEADAQKSRDAGRPAVLRFKMPERDFVIPDQILGDVDVAASELSDFVIVKNDGWPTYHFAVVVDDFDMKITHVLRGQEHLLNSANHMALQEAFGYPTPAYAHLPIIFTMKGGKMSKREKLVVIREAIAPWMDRHAQGDGKATTYLQRLSAVAGRGDGDLGRKIILNITEGTAPDYETLRLIADYLHVTVPEIDIHDFRKSGYLPEVLVNFIALLGWSPGDDREKMTLAELCELFGVDRVGKKSARFDREKLLSFNTTALEAASMEHKLAAFRDYLSVNEAGPLTGLDDALLERLMKLCAGFRTFSDIVTKCAALFAPDESLEYDPKAVKKWLLKGERPGLKVLEELREALQGLDDWSSENLDAFIRAFAEQRELGLGKVAQPLRVATTGTTISPQISDTLALLGRERTLARIDRALEQIVAS